MDKAIDKLESFIHSNRDASEYFSLAVETMYQDILEDFDCETPLDILGIVGKLAFDIYHDLIVQFFCSNAYGGDTTWNVVDAFLKSKKSKTLSSDEKSYLNALKNSHMSLYEIVSIEKDTSITVKDLIEPHGDIIVTDKKQGAFYGMKKGSILGMRLLNFKKQMIATNPILMCDDFNINNIIKDIQILHQLTVTFAKDSDKTIAPETIIHLSKVMWATVISHEWFHIVIENKRKKLKNNEGHNLCNVIITLPLLKPIDKKFSQNLLKNKEFLYDDNDKMWIWHLTNPKKRGEVLVKARIEPQGDELLVTTNSAERGNIIEDILQNLVGDYLGKAVFEKSDFNLEELLEIHGLNQPPIPTSNTDDDMDSDTKETLLKAFKTMHYRGWIKSRIPALDDKTPRMAMKTKAGKEKVIELLLGIDDIEQNAYKNSGSPVYNTDWIWQELKLTRPETV